MKPALDKIQAAYKRLGYRMYDKPFDLNIFGVRSDISESDQFDDWVGFWCKDEQGGTIFYTFPATTDPGKNWLLTPMKSDGTAIMVPGQYAGLYKKGFHKTYPALEQKAPAQYVRDNDRNTKLDFSLYRDPLKRKIHAFWDNIKSNIHKAGALSKLVGAWSAACQVFQKETDFDILMKHVDKQIAYGHGNSFSYTLLEESQLL